MDNRAYIKQSIRDLMSDSDHFEEVAEMVFDYQMAYNPTYRQFAGLLRRTNYAHVPFLPVEFFKSHEIKTTYFDPEIVFTSSGTTGMVTSRHFVYETKWYEEVFTQTFINNYGNPADFCFLCLLPSYLERDGSSLVYMAESLIRQSKYDSSGFYLKANDDLIKQLTENQRMKIPTVLLGVTFALLDLAESRTLDLGDTIVMETGGMKGRRKEMTRPELHEILTSAFGVKAIHSEYGMTELMSQAYSKGAGIFSLPSQMKIIITDVNDPFEKLDDGRTGTVNIIDLANVDSCAFLATKDLGRTFPDGTFEILGRYDHSDVRGCNLLIA